MIFDASPFEYFSNHLHLVGWPVLLAITWKYGWKISQFFIRQEVQVHDDREKLKETHEISRSLLETNRALLDEWHQENGSLKELVDNLTSLQRDFHDHQIEDRFSFKAIIDGVETIKKRNE